MVGAAGVALEIQGDERGGEMRRIRKTVLWTMAVLAILAVASAVASARLPEWGKCVATAGATSGKYEDAACTVRARQRHHHMFEGGYEWEPLGRIHGEPITLNGALTFETASGAKIECPALSDESEITLIGPSTTRTPLWEFAGCHSEGTGAGFECGNTVAQGRVSTRVSWREEEIVEENEEEEEIGTGLFRGWTSRLGYISERAGANPVVGLSFKPHNVGERLIDPPIRCESAIGTVWIGGERKGGNSVISTIGPVDEMTTTFTQTYSESASGIQTPTEFERGRRDVLQAFIHNHWEPVAIVGTMSYELERGDGQELEIKAVK